MYIQMFRLSPWTLPGDSLSTYISDLCFWKSRTGPSSLRPGPLPQGGALCVPTALGRSRLRARWPQTGLVWGGGLFYQNNASWVAYGVSQAADTTWTWSVFCELLGPWLLRISATPFTRRIFEKAPTGSDSSLFMPAAWLLLNKFPARKGVTGPRRSHPEPAQDKFKNVQSPELLQGEITLVTSQVQDALPTADSAQ